MNENNQNNEGQVAYQDSKSGFWLKELFEEWGYLIRLKEVRTFCIILILAFIHGLIYIFLMPPWQHFDEPNHFEYVWLAAIMDRIPDEQSYDPDLSRQVLVSMLANDFYRDQEFVPNIPAPGEQVRIPGYSQLPEPPLYFLSASLPLRWFNYENVEQQLYAARVVSLVFFLITIIASWGVVWELTSEGNPLRWMLPLTLALLPGFVDVMTAANSDSAAVAVFSLFFWGAVRLMKRGMNFFDLIWVVFVALLTYFAKNTAMYAIVFLPIVILFSIFRGPYRKILWSLIALVSLVGLFVIFDWGDAAFWYRSTSQVIPTRAKTPQAILGEYVFRLDSQAEITPGWLSALFQPLSTDKGQRLAGKQVTFGGWVWATEPVKIESPSINTPSSNFNVPLEISKQQTFFAFQASLPEDAWRTWVVLARKFSTELNVEIFYDGLVFAEGDFPLDSSPVFGTTEGVYGEWGGKPFENLLQNPSAEKAGPRIRSLFDDLGAKILPDRTRLSLVLTSIMDLKTSGFLYKTSIDRLFKTFWAWFGWGHIPLLWEWEYWLLGGFSLLGAVGIFAGLARNKHTIPWEFVFLFGFMVVMVWGFTILRGAIYLAVPKLYIPVARHAYPIIIPTLFVICLGWSEWFENFRLFLLKKSEQNSEMEHSKFLRFSVMNVLYVIYIAFFVLLDILSIVSIMQYYA